ncbi:hypothetical protein [Erwinia billingiae]|uniref:hypothetical protein n=1 Tax=Erwinia billingiae TaxID=182337 RepID=UPI00069E7A33|nr:hypothetical protein [Erwinia billingiae]
MKVKKAGKPAFIAIQSHYFSGICAGNTEVRDILQKHQRLGVCAFITHELYSITKAMLQEDAVDFTLDQNAHQHARLSIELLLSHLETGYQPALYEDGKVDLKIVTCENLG